MPHKRNQEKCERICGLARVIRGHALTAMENVALWHERDISNSSVERVILPDATLALDFMLQRFAQLVESLVVHAERMTANLQSSHGLVFSGQLLVALAAQGLPREEAYRLVQGHAMEAFETGGDFRERILADKAIAKVLSQEEINRVFSLDEALRHVDAIFERTLREGGAG
jgi:adenylosuccinate lyase